MLGTLKEVYPHREITDEAIELYCMALADLDATALGAGTWACVKACKFFPTIAEIRAAATEEYIPQYAKDAWNRQVGGPITRDEVLLIESVENEPAIKHPLPEHIREMIDNLSDKCSIPYTPPPPKAAVLKREPWTPEKIHLTSEEIAAQSRKAADMQAQFARMAQGEK